MQTYASTAIAGSIIQQLFSHFQQHLLKEQQQKQLISYLTAQTLFCIHSCWDLSALETKVNTKKKMKEDGLNDVPHLNKDTLMPKELSKEEPVLQNRSNISITSLGLKKTVNPNSISFLSQSARPRSLLLKQPKNTKKSKEKESCLSALKNQDEIQDPQIEKLRGRTEMRLQSEMQYKKLQLKHQKSFKDKSQVLSSFLSQQPTATLTHDYDCEQLKSVTEDDKIRYYSMRTGISPSNVSGKDNNRTLQPLQTEVTKQKSSKEKQPYRSLKPMEMPFFEQKKLQLKMNGIQTYKLNEYRKQFARGYSRLDNLNKTIEYVAAKEQDDPFSQKRHLVDTLQTSVVGSSSMHKSSISRRLALPKLHGRYKVLDRYEQQQ